MGEDELSYDETLALAARAEVNECRLICSDELTELWAQTLGGDTIFDYCEQQYIALQQFCKAIIEGGSLWYPDYRVFVERAYTLFTQHFNAAAKSKEIAQEARDKLFYELNDRVTINLFVEKKDGPEYEVRTLVFVIYLLPPHVKKQPYFKEYMNNRPLHHYKVNTLH
jgi:hypothetical protein